MTTILFLELAFLVVLLVLSAFFSSAEVAFFALNPLQIQRLKSQQDVRVEKIQEIIESPTKLLSTILIGNTLVNVALSTITYAIAIQLFVVQGEAIAVAISLFLLLIFGEIGPKRIAVNHPEKMATLYAPILLFFIHLLSPLRKILEHITRSFSPFFQPKGRVLSEQEFTSVVKDSTEEGILDEDESTMLRGIIRLEDLRASDVMKPRVDIIGIDLNEAITDAPKIIKSAKVRQILLYRDQLDNVEGFLDVRSYLLDATDDLMLARIPPIFIPEACPLDKLLTQFMKEHSRAAVVVDEYGGTAGIVTRGDILEEITGDIQDEQGSHELYFKKIAENTWLLDGQVSLEKLSEELGISFEEEGVDRIAGWISSKLERLPRVGEVVEDQSFQLIVRQMRKNRVCLVELRKKEQINE